MIGATIFIAVCVVLALPWLWAAWQWCRPVSSTSPRKLSKTEDNDV